MNPIKIIDLAHLSIKIDLYKPYINIYVFNITHIGAIMQASAETADMAADVIFLFRLELDLPSNYNVIDIHRAQFSTKVCFPKYCTLTISSGPLGVVT